MFIVNFNVFTCTHKLEFFRSIHFVRRCWSRNNRKCFAWNILQAILMCCQRVWISSQILQWSVKSLERFFVCHCALVPNNKFALLQYFSHPRWFGNVASGNFCRLHIQRQFQSGMSSSPTKQQSCGYIGRRKGQRYVIFWTNWCQNQSY